MYTTKRFKRAHSVFNLKVLSTCFKLRTLCPPLYLFVECILFTPVILTRISRSVNSSHHISPDEGY